MGPAVTKLASMGDGAGRGYDCKMGERSDRASGVGGSKKATPDKHLMCFETQSRVEDSFGGRL